MPQHGHNQEPIIDVGIIDLSESTTIRLEGAYTTSDGNSAGPGEIHVDCRDGVLRCRGAVVLEVKELEFTPDDFDTCQFSLEAVIGIDFHWQQTEMQHFRGSLRLLAQPGNRVTVVNRVPVETYITSVICSEMNADSAPESIKSHAVISRSWLLAQLDARDTPPTNRFKISDSEIIRWTEREAHAAFDVCADDHCQRYQGIGRTDAPEVAAAIAETRGLVLAFEGRACDTRFSKCCGGVVEEYQTAWGDESVPYLVALNDTPDSQSPLPALTDEATMRAFIEQPPTDVYCNCTDAAILNRVLNDYDRTTHNFFRWQVRLDAERATQLVSEKLGVDLGRLLAMEPIERGPSGRLFRLRLTGETASLVIGKELEIRRALSESHLYSSAFVIDAEGPAERPDAFVLTGAGWGHGVGLCQIGAAVMACQGSNHQDILKHYYPATALERFYA